MKFLVFAGRYVHLEIYAKRRGFRPKGKTGWWEDRHGRRFLGIVNQNRWRGIDRNTPVVFLTGWEEGKDRNEVLAIKDRYRNLICEEN